jgi:hypothetical protein
MVESRSHAQHLVQILAPCIDIDKEACYTRMALAPRNLPRSCRDRLDRIRYIESSIETRIVQQLGEMIFA